MTSFSNLNDGEFNDFELEFEYMGLSEDDNAIIFGSTSEYERALFGLSKEDHEALFGEDNGTADEQNSESDDCFSDNTNPALELLVLEVLGLLNEEKHRSKKVRRSRQESWEFIMTWTDDLFYKQFRLPKEEFFQLCEKIKSIYPGRYRNGLANYKLSQKRGAASTPDSGPVTLEIKLAVTLRILAGASELDMIWYGVQLRTVSGILDQMLPLIDKALPDDKIFNFNPKTSSTEEFLMADSELILK